MNQIRSSDLVPRLMREFAYRTGLDPVGKAPRRYLWTDAFAVCNFLELHRQTGEASWRELSLRLVNQVHHTLGRHRADDPRSGWISGLNETEGELHPTSGGLRIGKQENERRPGEPPDERREWGRDGQYYHYLTKWMHALHRVSRVTGDRTYDKWALELAQTTHERFSYRPSWGVAKRLYWKMSIDLSRPLVSSMGQHDPLDGLVTYSELQAAAGQGTTSLPDLQAGITELAVLCRDQEWGTDDPLGIGGLLFDASRVAQLTVAGCFGIGGLLEKVVDAALAGLELYEEGTVLEPPAEHRLAFRELGLSIGLHSVRQLQSLVQDHSALFEQKGSLPAGLAALTGYLPIGERIESFWMDETNQRAASWTGHREINMVMLATSLAPGGFIII